MNDLAVARAAAGAAGAVVARWFGHIEHSDLKGAVDPVTRADQEAEAAIVAILSERRPDDGVLGEEGSAVEAKSGRRWVIDPLDGTVNYLHGVPQAAVSIGLEDADGGVAAVVLDVFRNEEFAVARGEGATLNGEPIRVSSQSEMVSALFSTGYAYDRQIHGAAYSAVTVAVMREAQGVRRLGAAALDLAWVACGRYEGHWEFGLKPWDLSAGALLIAEAGGRLTDSYGAPARPEDVVATNGFLHESLREIVAANRPPHLSRP